MPANDIKIDPITNDIVFVDGRLQMVTGADAAGQRIRSRLTTFRGEWFLNLLFGLPYLTDILKKAPELPLIASLIKAEIVAGGGVGTRVTRFNMVLDPTTRQLTIDSDAVVPEDGETTVTVTV